MESDDLEALRPKPPYPNLNYGTPELSLVPKTLEAECEVECLMGPEDMNF